MRFLIRTLVTAVGLWVATATVSGIHVSGGNAFNRALTLIGVAIIFGLVNAILKPLVKVFGCLFYVLTLGLFALVVNALMFLLAGWLSRLLHLPLYVDGFWPAFWGAIIVSVVSWAINLVLGDRNPGPAKI
jgi:putative membrane protein